MMLLKGLLLQQYTVAATLESAADGSVQQRQSSQMEVKPHQHNTHSS
jgi:hypothetical protein